MPHTTTDSQPSLQVGALPVPRCVLNEEERPRAVQTLPTDLSSFLSPMAKTQNGLPPLSSS